MNKRNSLYVATKLENGMSDLVCIVAKKREDLEEISGVNIREVIEYKTREQAIIGIREELPYLMEDVYAFLYDNMVKNGGFFRAYV